MMFTLETKFEKIVKQENKYRKVLFSLRICKKSRTALMENRVDDLISYDLNQDIRFGYNNFKIYI